MILLSRSFFTRVLFLASWVCVFQNFCFAFEVVEQDEPTWQELDAHGFAEANRLKTLLQNINEDSDLARAKLEIDRLIAPSIDVDANLKKIDSLVVQIRIMLANQHDASDGETMSAIRKFVYDAGPWNDYRPFSYDLDDPQGQNIQNKLLSTYLTTRKGNCVSMPILLTILGQRLGLDVTLSTAPFHELMMFTDRVNGKTLNIEATSGGYPARETWLKQQFPTLTDASIQSGAYLKRLSKKESVAVMARAYAEYLMDKRLYREAVFVSEIILHSFVSDPETMVRIGSCFEELIRKEFISKYPRPIDIPEEQRGYFNYLSNGNRFWFAKAESLGWRQPSEQEDVSYMKKIEDVKSPAQ